MTQAYMWRIRQISARIIIFCIPIIISATTHVHTCGICIIHKGIKKVLNGSEMTMTHIKRRTTKK